MQHVVRAIRSSWGSAVTRSKGMLADRFTLPVLDAVQQLEPLADEVPGTVAQLGLAWRLRDAPAIVAAELEPELLRQIDDLRAPAAPPVTV